MTHLFHYQAAWKPETSDKPHPEGGKGRQLQKLYGRLFQELSATDQSQADFNQSDDHMEVIRMSNDFTRQKAPCLLQLEYISFINCIILNT